MQAAIPRVVRFKNQSAAESTFDADVRLIAFGNTQARVEPAGEPGVQNAELFDQGRIDCQCLRKMKVSSDEGAPLCARHDLPGCRIDKRVRVEKQLLRTQSEIIDRSQQCAIVEYSRAASDNGIA